MPQIPNHAHCVICSRAIAHGEKTCGPECKQKLEDIDRKRKRSMTLMYVLMGLAVLVMLFSFRSAG